jgi:AcrR family transcriptional regulator
LVEAMTQTAARYGHGNASVARVVEQAGVSRATFYKNFADKEACFLAAFEVAAEPVEVALERTEVEQVPADRARVLLQELLNEVSHDPAGAHILMLDARAGGRQARLAHERLMALGVETLERWLRAENEDGWRLAITGRAVMEGVIGVISNRAFRGEAAQIAHLHNDLVAWILSYAVQNEPRLLGPEDWRRLGAGFVEPPPPASRRASPRRLPRGRGALAPQTVAGEQRERILAALPQLARTLIYQEMSVADIVKEAGVTRESFYQHFRSKEDAFLAAQSAGLEASISVAAAKFFVGDNWPERIWDGLEALLSFTAARPDLIYLDVIESPAVGSAALRRSFDNLMAYTLFIEDGYRQRRRGERLPRLCSEAVAASVLGMMRRMVYEDRSARMAEILPQSAYVILAPFIGPAAAMDFVEAKAALIDGTLTA